MNFSNIFDFELKNVYTNILNNSEDDSKDDSKDNLENYLEDDFENDFKNDLENYLEDDFENNINRRNKFIVKSFIIIMLLLFSIPIAYSDIYYGINDEKCTQTRAPEFDISLKQYLIISGYCSITMTIIIIISIIFYNNKHILLTTSLIYVICSIYIFGLDLIANHINNINNINKIQCSDELKKYLNSSLDTKLQIHLDKFFVFCSCLYNYINEIPCCDELKKIF